MDVATLAELLRETAQHHDHYEKTHPKHNWWDWYAPYLGARQNGSTPEEAAAAADRYMEKHARESGMHIDLLSALAYRHGPEAAHRIPRRHVSCDETARSCRASERSRPGGTCASSPSATWGTHYQLFERASDVTLGMSVAHRRGDRAAISPDASRRLA